MVSKLSLLEFISLYHCKMANGHLQRYLKTVPLSKKFSYYSADFSDETLYKAPFTVEKIQNRHEHDKSFEVDASVCTQLSISVSLTRNSKISICNRLYLGQSNPLCKL